MIRVVVTGSECTGKTTLTRGLADHFQTVWVPEYVRRFVEELGRTPEFSDVDAIARGQQELEGTVAAEASRLLILDTDLLSPRIYSEHYYGDYPPWIEQALRDRPAELYLLAGIDVPWIPDGAQRDRGDRREEMHELFRRALLDRALPFVEVSGTEKARLERAISVVEPLLSRPQSR